MLVVRVVNSHQLEVIHYSDSSDVSGAVIASATIAKSGCCIFAEVVCTIEILDPINEKIEILEYPRDVAQYTGREAVERGRENIGEQSYNLFLNNCESFVNWCIIDKRVSNQGEKAVVGVGVGVGVGAGIIALAGIGVGVGLTAWFASRKQEDTDSDD